MTLQKPQTVEKEPADIADAIERSTSAVYSILQSLSKTSGSFRFGRPPLLNPAQRKIPLRNVCNRQSIARQNCDAHDIPLPVSLVRKILRSDPHIRCRRMGGAPQYLRYVITER